MAARVKVLFPPTDVGLGFASMFPVPAGFVRLTSRMASKSSPTVSPTAAPSTGRCFSSDCDSAPLWTLLFTVRFPLKKGVEEGSEGTLTVEVNSNVEVDREGEGVDEGTKGTAIVEVDNNVEVNREVAVERVSKVFRDVEVDREVAVERESKVFRDVKVDKDVAVDNDVKLEKDDDDDEVLVAKGVVLDNGVNVSTTTNVVDEGLGAEETETVEDAAVDEGLEIEVEAGLPERRAAYSKRRSIDETTFSLMAQGIEPGLNRHCRTLCI